MPSKPRTRTKRTKADTAPLRSDETSYAQLLTLLKETRGRFSLVLVRGGTSTRRRDEILARLAADLAPDSLKTVRLDREHWDALALVTDALASKESESPVGAIAIVGLEDTPGMFATVAQGSTPPRPKALAVLNHGRETLRARCPVPIILWCDRLTFPLLQTHAPDFFDHFTGIVRFEDQSETKPGPEIEAKGIVDRPLPRPEFGSASAVRFYDERLKKLHDPTSDRAEVLLGLAESLRTLRDKDHVAHLERAKSAVTEAVKLISRQHRPQVWARAQSVLGSVMADLPTGDRADNLRRAIEAYRAALHIFTEVDFPSDWAMTQNNLGNAYRRLPTGDRAENLRRAIEAYRAALRVYTEAGFPYQWAATQNNIGAAYADLPTGDKADNLRRAIEAYRAALRVRTESGFPSDWAMTQYNIGAAYADLPTGDGVDNLRRAIEAYQAALRVRTEVDFPADWAMTQNCLGNAYRRLPTGDRAENLRRAIAYYNAALSVWTQTAFPYDYATALDNYIQTTIELAKLG